MTVAEQVTINRSAGTPHTASDRAGNPPVWILILNYCSLQDTLECFEHARRSSYENLKILVLDNASPDGSGHSLASELPPQCFVQVGRNLGYAGGNNAGIKLALDSGAEYVLIVNPDVRLPIEAVSDYVSVMSADSTIGALNAIQLDRDGQTIDRSFRDSVLAPMGYVGARMSDNAFRDVFPVGTLFGAALMLAAAALRRVGGFDPLYFAYGEEIDLCRRIRFHGYRLVVTARSPVLHLRTQYTGGVSDFVLFLKLKGYYLGKLKDPCGSFPAALKETVLDFCSALLGRTPDGYPFNTHRVGRYHLLKALGWFAVNAMTAWRHKRLEIRGAAYL